MNPNAPRSYKATMARFGMTSKGTLHHVLNKSGKRESYEGVQIAFELGGIS